MVTPVRIGMDTSKSVFQLHGVDEKEAVVLRRQFRRNEMIRFFEKLPPTLVAIESCGSSTIGPGCCSRSDTRSS
jgi:transposase